MELSSYQKKIVDYYKENPHGNMQIAALAGSGKSTTAKLLSDASSQSTVYLAFNNSVAKEFKEKFSNPKTKVYTLHGIGYSIMNANLSEGSSSTKDKVEVDNLKVNKLLDEIVPRVIGNKRDFGQMVFYKNEFARMFSLLRLTLSGIEPEDIGDLMREHNLFESYLDDYPVPPREQIIEVLNKLSDADIQKFEDDKVIDFTDMLWITYLKLKAREWKTPYYHLYYNVLVDEVQDLSNLQLRLLPYLKQKMGRYVFCGDFNQSICMYAGANARAFNQIPKLFAPIEKFDLPICYRCATSHLTEVNNRFDIPILPREGAPKGFIKTIQKIDIVKYIKPGDMIISRKNKWLANVLTTLVGNGITVYIPDVDFVKGILKTIDKAKKKSTTLSDWSYKLEEAICSARQEMEDHCIKMLQAKSKIPMPEEALTRAVSDEALTEVIEDYNGIADNQRELVHAIVSQMSSPELDNLNFIKVLIGSYDKKFPGTKSNSGSLTKFYNYVEQLLNTTPNPKAVRISTVHKAKGLEATNVFVLNEGKICHDFRNSPEQNQQEKNLSYISFTRAKEGLYLVKEPKETV